MAVCDICKRLAEEIGMPCTPLSCPCNCHAKSRRAIYAVNQKAGFDNRTIAKRIKAGEGLY